LILPVVICLSQRLSHARVRSFSGATRTQIICGWLIITVINLATSFFKRITPSNAVIIRVQKEPKRFWRNGCRKDSVSAAISFFELLAWTTVLVAWKRYFLLIRYVVSVRVKQASHEYGESVFDSGEGAWEMATTSKDGSRRENYPIQNLWGSDKI